MKYHIIVTMTVWIFDYVPISSACIGGSGQCQCEGINPCPCYSSQSYNYHSQSYNGQYSSPFLQPGHSVRYNSEQFLPPPPPPPPLPPPPSYIGIQNPIQNPIYSSYNLPLANEVRSVGPSSQVPQNYLRLASPPSNVQYPTLINNIGIESRQKVKPGTAAYSISAEQNYRSLMDSKSSYISEENQIQVAPAADSDFTNGVKADSIADSDSDLSSPYDPPRQVSRQKASALLAKPLPFDLETELATNQPETVKSSVTISTLKPYGLTYPVIVTPKSDVDDMVPISRGSHIKLEGQNLKMIQNGNKNVEIITSRPKVSITSSAIVKQDKLLYGSPVESVTTTKPKLSHLTSGMYGKTLKVNENIRPEVIRFGSITRDAERQANITTNEIQVEASNVREELPEEYNIPRQIPIRVTTISDYSPESDEEWYQNVPLRDDDYPYATYYNQACTGKILAVMLNMSVVTAAQKCADLGCDGANAKPSGDRLYDVTFLSAPDGRYRKPGTYCVSRKRIKERSYDSKGNPIMEATVRAMYRVRPDNGVIVRNLRPFYRRSRRESWMQRSNA